MAAMGIGGVEIASDLAEARQARISVAAALRGAVALAADLLFPPVCISCRKRAGAHGLLCGDCWPKIDFITPPLCAKLGLPLPYDTGEPSLSAAAMAEPPVYDRGRAAARYSSTMRELIQRFKYGDRHEGVALFRRWMAAAGAELLTGADVIVPVPLYRSRLWSRRFNQSAILAQAVSRLTRVPIRLLSACPRQAHAEPGRADRGATGKECRRRVPGHSPA